MINVTHIVRHYIVLDMKLLTFSNTTADSLSADIRVIDVAISGRGVLARPIYNRY